jgi:peptidoglycan/xylan/chitin deacetylase (PgdA/CDA1 family)
MLGRPLILMYHGFGRRPPAGDPHHLFVPPEDLERQLRFLTRAWRPLDLSAYIAGWDRGRWPARSFLITMDDGYTSVLDTAAPLLLRFRVPAVLFVPPGRLGGSSGWMHEMETERILSAEQLKELSSFGIDIGVHGMDHTLLPGLTEDALEVQVAGAREALADLTGVRPTAFAYPQGLFDQAAVRAVRRAGYAVGFAVLEGDDRYTVTRRPITPRDSIVTFAAKTLPGFEHVWRLTSGNRSVRRLAAWIAGQRRSATR